MKNKAILGQTILEAVIALAAILIILAAVSVSVVTSINNSSFIKNQNLASKYAQEGIEYIRNVISSDTSSTSQYNNFVTNLVGSERCFGPIDPSGANPIGTACSSASTTNVNIPAVSPAYKRTVRFESGKCTSEGDFSDGLVVTVRVYWSSGKCTSTDTFCHKQEVKTCFIDPAIAAPTPGI